MQTFPVFDKDGLRAPVFQIENIYISARATARLLAATRGVTDVQPRKMFSKSSDVYVQFKHQGRSYIVWEPYGDNSRHWIGPADMVNGATEITEPRARVGIEPLEAAFENYRPPLHRAILGDLLTLRFINRLLKPSR